MIIRFTIPGTPQQQGSRRYVGNGITIEANKNLEPWRKVALSCAREAKGGTEGPLFTGPVQVTMVAYFPRPASHYGTGRNSGVLKPSAPVWHASAPDCDKLERALGDMLTQSGVVLDDRLIVCWDASKVYGDPRMDVTVTDAGEMPAVTPAAEDAGELYDTDLLTGSRP
jgi:Holliday junction resolvase RusA-like endonuclease